MLLIVICLISFKTPWDVIPQIGTVISLIAFIVALFIWYKRFKVLQRRKTLQNTPESNQVKIAEMVLDDFNIPLDNLTGEQKFNLAKQKLKAKARHRMTLSILLAFLAVLAFVLLKDMNQENGLTESVDTVGYELFLEVYQDSITEKIVEGDFEHRNDFCQGEFPIDWPVYSDTINGWFIEVSSINVSHTVRSNSVFHGVFNRSSSGYNIRGIVRNSGSCEYILGKLVAKDARGKITAHYSHKEIKKVKTISKYKKTIKGRITPGHNKEIEIPENTANYSIVLKNENGVITKLSNRVKEQGPYSVQKTGKTGLLLSVENKIR